MRAVTIAFGVLVTLGASAQNVGINTDGSAPGMMLDVKTATSATSDGIRINNSNTGNGDAILNFQNNGTNVWTMGFDDSDADRFKIDDVGALGTDPVLSIEDIGADGNVGINVNAPLYALHVTATTAGNYMSYFENFSATGSGIEGYVTGTFNAIGGVTNNTAGLGVYGVHLPATGGGWAMYGASNSSDAVGVRGAVPTTGSWLGYGGLFSRGLGYINGAYNLSDRKVKKDINSIPNALNKIMQLEGVTYKYNDQYSYVTGNDTRTYLGFIAQDVKTILPEVVAEKSLTVNGPENAGQTLNRSDFTEEIFNVVDYTAIVPVLVEAMKEQQKQIEELKNQIKLLENKSTKDK